MVVLHYLYMDLFMDGLPLPNCPFCGASYKAATRESIEGGEGDEELVHVTCAECSRALVVSTVRTEATMQSIGMITDCSAADYARFHFARKVCIDDVIRVHERLRI